MQLRKMRFGIKKVEKQMVSQSVLIFIFLFHQLFDYSMSESRLQNSLSSQEEEDKFSANEQGQQYSQDQNKAGLKQMGRPRGRGRPKLNQRTINKKKLSDDECEEEPIKAKERIVTAKQENQIEGYVRIVDFLKKIQCDELSFQNKMNPYHSLTAISFWYMISAEYFSYDFYSRQNPSEAAYNILNRVSKLPIQMPTRFIKNVRQGQILEFQTDEVKNYGCNISEFLSHLIPPPSSINKCQNLQKKVSMTTVAQDNEFISSTRALLFNYVKNKFDKSQKWASTIKSRLQDIQNLGPKLLQNVFPISFQDDKQEIIDATQLDILSRQVKKKKSQKKKVKDQQFQKQNDESLHQQEFQNQKLLKQSKMDIQIQHSEQQKVIKKNDSKMQSEYSQKRQAFSPNKQIKSPNRQEQKLQIKQMTSDEVLLSTIIHLPLQKTISLLQSCLSQKYALPAIQKSFMPIPKSDPLEFVYQLHEDEQRYLEYMKQYQKKQYQQKIIKGQDTIEEQQREIQCEDAKCQICTDGDYTDDNLIVFCSKCNISLHQRCIGLAKVPAQSWVCDVCFAFGPAGANVPCPLCNVKGGALKRTSIHIDSNLFKQTNPGYYEYAKKCDYNKHKQQYTEGQKILANPIKQEKNQALEESKIGSLKQENSQNQQKDELYYDYFNKSTYPNGQPTCHYVWVHYVCAIWVPECYFEQKNGAINIKGIQNIQKRRYKHECLVCKKVKNGACVKCEDSQCKKYYHPQCARKKKVYMEQLNLQKIKYLIFCEEHEPLMITRQIQYKNKKNRDQIIKFARMIQKYVQTYKIAYFPYKLMKIIPTKSFIQTCQIQQKQEQYQKKVQIIKQTDEDFIKDIIIKLSKAKKMTVTVVKTETGFKISEINQPSRRQLRKCLNKYDDFWQTIMNGQSVQQNCRRYQRITKENLFLKEKMQLFLNGASLASFRGQITQKEKKAKARGKSAKVQVQTQIQEEGAIFCICRKPYQGELDMLECQVCGEWYHYNCIGFIGTEVDAQTLDFHCMKCMKFQTEDQKRPRLKKCIQFFATDSIFLNYRPPTPKLMSEQSQNQIKQSLILEQEENKINGPTLDKIVKQQIKQVLVGNVKIKLQTKSLSQLNDSNSLNEAKMQQTIMNFLQTSKTPTKTSKNFLQTSKTPTKTSKNAIQQKSIQFDQTVIVRDCLNEQIKKDD